jgi:hypothetical protein
MLTFGFSALVLLGGCAKTSDNPRVVTAPVASGVPLASAAVTATAATGDASAPGDAAASGTSPAAASLEADAGPAAAFQACKVDSDCVAVPRVGCCHNGWKEAVNVAQQDAYAASFTCPRREMCPMFIIRDQRVPRCDPAAHLCAMVRLQP